MPEPGSACAERRGPGPQTLPAHCFRPERLQGIFSPSSGETGQCPCPSQCPCLLLSPCWVSSPGISSRVMPGGEAATNMQAQQKRCPVGTRAAPLSPLPQSCQSSQHWRLKICSHEHGQALRRGRGCRRWAGGLGEMGDLGKHLLSLYYSVNPGFCCSDANSSSHR